MKFPAIQEYDFSIMRNKHFIVFVFLRVSGKYLYFRNRINLAQYEKYFTIKKFKSYEDIYIQINNFHTHNLPKKLKMSSNIFSLPTISGIQIDMINLQN